MTFKLNRFSDDKQDQIEQLIEYAQLLGLTGRDLVAIGGKIDRLQAKQRKDANMVIIKGFECLPIGKDTNTARSLDKRFKLKTSTGTYNFETGASLTGGWDSWTVTNLKTKVKKGYNVDPYEYDLPTTNWSTRQRYTMLLDIANGKFSLNF